MNIWMPIVAGGSGVEVFTHELSAGLQALGHQVSVDIFAHGYQYAPWMLMNRSAPEGTDVVIGNSWNAFAFKRDRIPLVSVQHLFVLDSALRPYKTWAQHIFHANLVCHFEQRTAAVAQRLVAVSQYTKATYEEHFPEVTAEVIRNGVDTAYFSPLPEQMELMDREALRVIFVGNLTRRKGADMLPQIMASLGDGYQLSYTSGLREKGTAQDRPNMCSLGRLSKEQMRDAYRRADVMVFPTRLEGLPLVALEAMACGTPVVATDGSSLPEIITDGVDGYLCTQDDVAAFVAPIIALSRDRNRLRLMGRQAREKIVREFSLEHMSTQYAELLQGL